MKKHKFVSENSRTARKLRRLMERDAGHCVYCRGAVRIVHDYYDVSPDRATIEHRTPYSRGGTDRLDNLALACYPCNNARGNGVIVRKKPFISAAQYHEQRGDRARCCPP